MIRIVSPVVRRDGTVLRCTVDHDIAYTEYAYQFLRLESRELAGIFLRGCYTTCTRTVTTVRTVSILRGLTWHKKIITVDENPPPSGVIQVRGGPVHRRS